MRLHRLDVERRDSSVCAVEIDSGQLFINESCDGLAAVFAKLNSSPPPHHQPPALSTTTPVLIADISFASKLLRTALYGSEVSEEGCSVVSVM